MKLRESGMPDEALWSSFFEPTKILGRMGLTARIRDAVDFGCGYGTFTVPAAQIVRGTVFAFDIEAEMVAATAARARSAGLTNVDARQRDFFAERTGLPNSSVDYVMLFNILHGEEPEVLLREAWRILGVEGLLAIIHWNHDPSTPRGPSMGIRPTPEQCRLWALRAGFEPLPPALIDLPPYHYGLLLQRSRAGSSVKPRCDLESCAGASVPHSGPWAG